MAEKLCLQWNDFQGNVKEAFESFRADKDFSDVTLACEDGIHFEAHKVILAASSPPMRQLLKQNKHAYPLIYMRGLNPENLSAILDFLYRGETNVLQENLESFLALAEELQLKGLIGQPDNKDDQTMNFNPKVAEVANQNQGGKHETIIKNKPLDVENQVHRKTVATFSPHGPEYLKELDAQVKSMMEKSQNIVRHGKQKRTAEICKVCGKEGAPEAIKDHIEANHLVGVSLPCDHCEKTFRSRVNLRRHKCTNYLLFIQPFSLGPGTP